MSSPRNWRQIPSAELQTIVNLYEKDRLRVKVFTEEERLARWRQNIATEAAFEDALDHYAAEESDMRDKDKLIDLLETYAQRKGICQLGCILYQAAKVIKEGI